MLINEFFWFERFLVVANGEWRFATLCMNLDDFLVRSVWYSETNNGFKVTSHADKLTLIKTD